MEKYDLAIIGAGPVGLFAASVEIKRIVYKYKLTDQEVANITGMKPSDFPIYHDRLQLILPKRYWPRVLDALQK